MKQYLTLRNLVSAIIALVAVTFFGLSFAAKSTLTMTGQGGLEIVFHGSVWGATSYTQSAATGAGSFTQEIPAEYRTVFALPLVGFISLGVGGLGAFAGSLFIKDEKVKKIVVLSAAGLVLVGGVFQFFNGQNGLYQAAKIADVSVEQIKETFTAKGNALCTTSGIMSCVSAVALGAFQFVPDKMLVK